MPVLEIAAATTAAAPSPWLFALGTVAVVLVSSLGPLSRLHERRARSREEQRAAAPVTTSTQD